MISCTRPHLEDHHVFPENARCEHHGVFECDVLLVRDDHVPRAVRLVSGNTLTRYTSGEGCQAHLVVLLHGNTEEHYECFVKLIHRYDCWVKEPLPDDHDKSALLVVASEWKDPPAVQNFAHSLLSGIPLIEPLRHQGPHRVEQVVLRLEDLLVVVAASVENSACKTGDVEPELGLAPPEISPEELLVCPAVGQVGTAHNPLLQAAHSLLHLLLVLLELFPGDLLQGLLTEHVDRVLYQHCCSSCDLRHRQWTHWSVSQSVRALWSSQVTQPTLYLPLSCLALMLPTAPHCSSLLHTAHSSTAPSQLVSFFSLCEVTTDQRTEGDTDWTGC